MHLDSLQRSGQHILSCEYAYLVFKALADAAVFLQLSLVAYGWTIVRRKISASKRVWIAIVTTCHLSLLFLMYTWAFFSTSAVSYTFYLTSLPGVLVVIFRVLYCLWFVWASLKTKSEANRKRRFYNKFTAFGAIWLLSMPIEYLICLALDGYVRKKFMFGIDSSFTFLCLFAMLVMYNPGSCSAGFPFHATTSQMVDIAKRKKKDAGSNPLVIRPKGLGGDEVEKTRHAMKLFTAQLRRVSQITELLKLNAEELEIVGEDTNADLWDEEDSDAARMRPKMNETVDSGSRGVELRRLERDAQARPTPLEGSITLPSHAAHRSPPSRNAALSGPGPSEGSEGK